MLLLWISRCAIVAGLLKELLKNATRMAWCVRAQATCATVMG